MPVRQSVSISYNEGYALVYYDIWYWDNMSEAEWYTKIFTDQVMEHMPLRGIITVGWDKIRFILQNGFEIVIESIRATVDRKAETMYRTIWYNDKSFGGGQLVLDDTWQQLRKDTR